MNEKLVVGVPFWNDDEDLWEVKIGDKEWNLWGTAWGKTEIEAIERAEKLVLLLNRNNIVTFIWACWLSYLTFI